MCGISGYIHRNNKVSAQNIMGMNAAIKHRGPDDEGFVCSHKDYFESFSSQESMPAVQQKYARITPDLNHSIALGFRRLSILDLSEKGHQPMRTEQVAITFNGEIYNYKNVRDRLISLGHKFEGNSDTEVILHAYLAWGINMLAELNGMFAIAIVDLKSRKAFLVRDRLGIKPLFYQANSTSISWCSEIKGLLKAKWIKATLHEEGLFLNYQFKSSLTPNTCFKDILSLEPGTYLSIDIDSLDRQQHTYWQIPSGRDTLNVSLEEATTMVASKIKESVQLQMQADVPLISMMSGGIDSTLITAIAKAQDPRMAAYTLSIDGSGKGADELPQAIKMAEHLDIQHLIQHLSDEDVLQNALQQMQHFEEPYNALDVIFNAASFLKYNDYKVILSGNGADEVFGGYAYNAKLPQWRKLNNWRALIARLPQWNDTLKKMNYYAQLDSVGEFFMSTTGGMRPKQLSSLAPHKNMAYFKQVHQAYTQDKDFRSDRDALFYYDLKYSVGAHHVYHDDLCAMKHSVEMRYPFLDYELIELVASLPQAYRYNNIENKPLLRKVAASYIAAENLAMPKKGFQLPQDRVLEQNKEMQSFVREQINYLKKREIFDINGIEQIYQTAFVTKNYAPLWQLVTTAVWLRQYL